MGSLSQFYSGSSIFLNISYIIIELIQIQVKLKYNFIIKQLITLKQLNISCYFIYYQIENQKKIIYLIIFNYFFTQLILNLAEDLLFLSFYLFYFISFTYLYFVSFDFEIVFLYIARALSPNISELFVYALLSSLAEMLINVKMLH